MECANHIVVFLPDDNVAPARRMRIEKAIERGACWIQVWGDSITHLVVDRGISYQSALKYFGLNELPVGVFTSFQSSTDEIRKIWLSLMKYTLLNASILVV
jgi:DNA polymerase IV